MGLTQIARLPVNKEYVSVNIDFFYLYVHILIVSPFISSVLGLE